MISALKSFVSHCKSFWDADSRWFSGYGIYGDYPKDEAFRPPRRPYRVNPHIRTAIGMLARSVASVPFIVSDNDGNVFERGPLVEALDSYPGGLRRFLYEYVGQFELTGEAHLVFDLVNPGDGTVHIFGASSMSALVSVDGLELRGWEVQVPDAVGSLRKYPVTVDDVHSWIDPDLYPGRMFRGLSKLEALALTLAEDHSAARHNATLLARGGGPRGLLKTEQTIQPEQADALEERFEAKYGRIENSFRVAVLGKGAEWQSIAQSNKDLMIQDSRKLSQALIYQAFGIPSVVAGGENEGGVKSHEANALNTFWVNRIWPLVSTVGENLTSAFVPRLKSPGSAGGRKSRSMYFKAARSASSPDVIIWGDLTQVPALREWHWRQMKTLTEAVDVGIPLNEAIEAMDLPFTPDKGWGDTWWVPAGKRPAEIAMKEPEPQPAAPQPDGQPPEKSASTIVDKSASEIAARWVDSWSGLADKVEKMLKAFFFRQRKEMLERLDAAPVLAADDVVTRDWFSDLLPDLVVENKILIDVMEPPTRDGLALGGEQIAAEVGGVNPFELSDDYYQQLLPFRMEKVKEANAWTKELLRIELGQATEAGETLQQIKQRVKGVFRHCIDSRAMTIARTETAMSVSQGRKVAMKENGVKGKVWLDSKDEHTRDSHLTAGREYAEGIAIDEKFMVGGFPMDHPSDPNGPAQEVINCRCALMPTMLGKSLVDVIRDCERMQFVLWSEA